MCVCLIVCDVCVSDCVCMIACVCVCVWYAAVVSISVMCGALIHNITRQNPCTQFIPLLRVMSIASFMAYQVLSSHYMVYIYYYKKSSYQLSYSPFGSMYTNESGLMSTVGY